MAFLSLRLTPLFKKERWGRYILGVDRQAQVHRLIRASADLRPASHQIGHYYPAIVRWWIWLLLPIITHIDHHGDNDETDGSSYLAETSKDLWLVQDKTIPKKTDFYKDDPATIMDEDPFNTDQPIKSESEISNQNLSVKFRMPLATAALIASIERLNTTTNHLPSKNRHQTKNISRNI